MDYARHDTPIGSLLLVGSEAGLAGIYTEQHEGGPEVQAHWHEAPERFSDVIQQLDEYFAGTRTRFQLRLAPVGTPFQMRVWTLLQDIELGQTRSYGELATALGNPNASRAVGAANARNPLSIVVPCHRVIGANGALTGYAGGEARKRWLLDHERRR